MSTNTAPLIIEPKQPAQACVIWLHGLGADGHDFASLPESLQTCNKIPTRFVLPNAPIRPVTLNAFIPMRAWYDIYSLTDLNKEDITGLQQSQTIIESLIQQQLDAGIATNRLILGGFSQGGACALYAGTRLTRKVAGIVALSCYLPQAQQTPTANQAPPILMMHGEHDDVVACTFGETSAEQLREKSYSVSWQTFPNAHDVCMPELTALDSWLAEQLL